MKSPFDKPKGDFSYRKWTKYRKKEEKAKKSSFKRLTKPSFGGKILLLSLWAYYAL